MTKPALFDTAPPIIWAVTTNAGRAPIDFEPADNGNVALEHRGGTAPLQPAPRPETGQPAHHRPRETPNWRHDMSLTEEELTDPAAVRGGDSMVPSSCSSNFLDLQEIKQLKAEVERLTRHNKRWLDQAGEYEMEQERDRLLPVVEAAKAYAAAWRASIFRPLPNEKVAALSENLTTARLHILEAVDALTPTPDTSQGHHEAVDIGTQTAPTNSQTCEQQADIGEPRWRVGRKVGRTIYMDGRLVGLMDTPDLARQVVEALAEVERLKAEAVERNTR